MAFDLSDIFNVGSPKTNLNYSSNVSNQYDYSKKLQVSNQMTYAPVSTTNTTTTTTDARVFAPSYDYSPQIAINSAGATQTSKKQASASSAPSNYISANPYTSAATNPSLAPYFTTPSSQQASQGATQGAGALDSGLPLILILGALGLGAIMLLKD